MYIIGAVEILIVSLFLNFNVQGCWQFEDKNPDGAFGAADLDPLDPTEWNMAIPVMTVSAN